MARDRRDDDIFPLTPDGLPRVPKPDDSDDQVSNDSMHLMTISTFNGLCRLIPILAACGILNSDDLAGIHDAMTTPLDDEELRDEESVASTRRVVERVLSEAMSLARTRGAD